MGKVVSLDKARRLALLRKRAEEATAKLETLEHAPESEWLDALEAEHAAHGALASEHAAQLFGM